MSKLSWPDNNIYFLTGSTFIHYPYFNDFNKKVVVLDQIKKFQNELNIPKVIYSIAINHYHLKFYLEKGSDLGVVKKYMHGGISFKYKKQYPIRYKEMWQSSRAYIIKSEEVDWKIAGYIIGNLLKHKEVSKVDELIDNPFCSFGQFVKEWGFEIAKDLVYSVIDVEENTEGVINFQEINSLKIKTPTKVG